MHSHSDQQKIKNYGQTVPVGITDKGNAQSSPLTVN